jgi:hypothetical protein
MKLPALLVTGLFMVSVLQFSLSKPSLAIKHGCPEGSPTIHELVKTGAISVDLLGDGKTTAESDLVVTVKKTGAAFKYRVPTLCISTKNQSPPPAEDVAKKDGVHYQIGNDPPASVVRIAQSARRAVAKGIYNAIPLAHPQEDIAQLSIWKALGKESGLQENMVTERTMKSDFLKQLNKNPKSLSSEQNNSIDRKLDAIFEAVDWTLKDSHSHTSEQTGTDDEGNFSGEVIPDQSHTTHEGLSTVTSDQPKSSDDFTSEKPQSSGLALTLPKPDEVLCIPPYTVFKTDNPQYQTMMIAKGLLIKFVGAMAISRDIEPNIRP